MITASGIPFVDRGESLLFRDTVHVDFYPSTGRWRKRSLGHTNRERAKAHADEQTAKLRAGTEERERGEVRLGLLFAAYQRYRTPRKSAGEQQQDDRRVELWTRSLGAD